MSYGTTDACWLLLGPDVRLMRTRYARKAAAAAIRQTNWPTAERFAAENVLKSPDAQETAAQFEAWAGRGSQQGAG